MSAIGSAITKEEWAELRRQACQSRPSWMEGLNPTNLPEVLLTYQQKLLSTTAQNELTVVEKSRRTGYTWAVGADAVLTSAASREAGGMNTFYMGYNLEMARDFIDVCAMWAKAFNQAASEVEEFVFTDRTDEGERDIKAFRITFASGYSIVALPSFARSLRGKQGYVILDEAAFHDDLAEVLKAALALLMWGGKVLVISTHDGELNPFAQLIEEMRKGRQPGALITLDFDQALRDGLYQRICMVTGKTWSAEAEAEWRDKIIGFYGAGADEELFVIPSAGSGTYIPSVLLERQQRPDIPVLRMEFEGTDFLALPDDLRHDQVRRWCEDNLAPLLAAMDPKLPSFLGEDFAMVGDLTVLWPGQVQQNMERRPAFVVELRNVPYAQQRQVLWFILDRLPRFTAAALDGTGNGAPLAQETATRYGLGRIAQVKINESWYREVAPKFLAAFEDGLTVLPRDLDIYNDHRALKKVRGIPQVQRMPQQAGKGEAAASGKAGGKKRHGDSVIAHLLFFLASQMVVEEYEYESAKPPATRAGQADLDDDDAGRLVFGEGGY